MSLSSHPISNQDLSGDFWNWCIWEKALSMISFAPSGFSFFWRQPEAHTTRKFTRARSVPEAERSSLLDKVKFKWRSIYWEAHRATDPNHVLQFHVINDKVEFLYLFPWLSSLYFNSRRLIIRHMSVIINPNHPQTWRRTSWCSRNSGCSNSSVSRESLSLGFRHSVTRKIRIVKSRIKMMTCDLRSLLSHAGDMISDAYKEQGGEI